LIQRAVVRHDQVGGKAYGQIIRSDHNSSGSKFVNFLTENHGVKHNSVGDEAAFPGVEDAGWYKVQRVFLAVGDNSVPGIVASLKTDNYVRIPGQQIHDFTLAFIAPLGADYNYTGHKELLYPCCLRRKTAPAGRAAGTIMPYKVTTAKAFLRNFCFST
jgi:hypothetical protein